MDASTENLINFHGFQQISDLFHGCFNKLQIFREPLQERAARLSDEAMAAQVRFSAILFVVNIITCTYTYTRTILAQGKRYRACCPHLAV